MKINVDEERAKKYEADKKSKSSKRSRLIRELRNQVLEKTGKPDVSDCLILN